MSAASTKSVMDLVGDVITNDNVVKYGLQTEILAWAIKELAPTASRDTIEAAFAAAMAEWDV